MRKLILLVFAVISMTIPVRAQFALKAGVSFNKNEISDFVLTGQFYKDLLLLSGDLYIPTRECEKISGGGRIGLGFGNYRIRFGGDIGAKYELKTWRIGYGAEANLRLYQQVGVFVRWARTYPILKICNHNMIAWKCGDSEISVGVVIDLTKINSCY
jgi:hypothetical protein